jgi:hypothetical protein
MVTPLRLPDRAKDIGEPRPAFMTALFMPQGPLRLE